MIRLIVIICCLNLFPALFAQQKIRIGLFQDIIPEAYVVHCISGEYQVVTNEGERNIRVGELVYLSLIGENILLSDGDLNFSYHKKILFKDISGNGVFRLRSVHPVGESGNYEGDLDIFTKNKALYAVNILDLDKYLAGVVETEGGPSAHPEFYKAMAIICRTYAIRNFNAHATEGFNLCDHTHCQAFKGKSEQNSYIPDAVLTTHNLVLTGRYFVLINAVYHSNSGGETRRASDIWTNEDEYLQAILDPFSQGQPNYLWEKVIPFNTWKNYLISCGIQSFNNADSLTFLINQPHRKKFFICDNDTLRIEKVRADLNLRSAFFDMNIKGDSIVFKGKGYGHGVGMSQEGAMEMARQGFSFSDILRFYYHQVHIRDLSNIPDEQLPPEFREKQ